MKHHLYAAASAIALAGGLAPSVALAQDIGGNAAPSASAQGSSSTSAVNEIVVTGSRVVSRVGFVAPAPIVAVQPQQLEALNPASLNDALRQLPALTNSAGPRGATGSAGSGGSFLNLRNLGASRTLTLLDGRRFVPTTTTGSADTALFPEGLIKRVDIVTGGASAAYGSDAVAGVINFLLDKSFTGVKGQAQYGIVDGGYSPEYKLSLTAGTTFGGGRGHLLFDGERYWDKGIFSIGDLTKLASHQWANNCQAIANPLGPTARIYACNVTQSTATAGGLVTTTALKGYTFDQNGVPYKYDPGTDTSASNQIGGGGAPLGFRGIQAGNERTTLFLRGSWDLTDKITTYVEASAAQTVYGYPVGSFSGFSGGTALTIQPDNAYLSPAFQTLMAQNKVTSSFKFGRFNLEIPRPFVTQVNNTDRIVLGADGRTFDTVWSVYYQHGVNYVNQKDDGIVNNNQVLLAVDAVKNASGQIVCRSTLTNPSNGCVPINFFGPNQPFTKQQLAYISSQNWFRTSYSQDVIAGSFSRDLFNLPAGPVSLAGGAEWRNEVLNGVGDPVSLQLSNLTGVAGPYQTGNYKVTIGSIKVTEGFLETVAPILADQPLVKELTFNGAVRETGYSRSGLVTTWKAGVTWRPLDIVRFRATRSRDIRAPNLNDLYNPGTINIFPSFTDNFYTPARIYPSVLNVQRGNPNLKPEIADTWTYGAVISPPWVKNLDFSVDAYDITINGAITSLTGPQLTSACALGQQSACAQTPRDPVTGNVTTVFQVPINLAKFNLRGLDFEAQYRFSLTDLYAPLKGDVVLRGLANYLADYKQTTPGVVLLDHTGETGLPRFTATWNASYHNGPLTFATNFRYTGSGPVDKTTLPTDLPQLIIPGQVLINTNIDYQLKALGGTYNLFLNVENLTNQISPPFADVSFYDNIGRTFRVGFKFRY